MALSPEGVLLVGARRADGASEAVYVFTNGESGWVETDRLLPPQPGSDFGRSLAFDGDGAFVGAPRAGADGSGSVYVFAGLAVLSEAEPSDAFHLSGARPNPAHGLVTLTLHLNVPGAVHAVVVDALGRQVAVLADGEMSGVAELRLDTSRLAAGVYVVRVESESFAETRRLTVVR